MKAQLRALRLSDQIHPQQPISNMYTSMYTPNIPPPQETPYIFLDPQPQPASSTAPKVRLRWDVHQEGLLIKFNTQAEAMWAADNIELLRSQGPFTNIHRTLSPVQGEETTLVVWDTRNQIYIVHAQQAFPHNVEVTAMLVGTLAASSQWYDVQIALWNAGVGTVTSTKLPPKPTKAIPDSPEMLKGQVQAIVYEVDNDLDVAVEKVKQVIARDVRGEFKNKIVYEKIRGQLLVP